MNITAMLNNLKENKKRLQYLLVFLGCGILLMLFPVSDQNEQASTADSDDGLCYSIEKEEQRLADLLSSIKGAGDCKVLLSVHNGEEIILAEDEGETVILSNSGKQSTVTVQTRYPEFQGAVVVSGGCKDANVRYDILSSVMAYTGLSVDRITICPMKE